MIKAGDVHWPLFYPLLWRGTLMAVGLIALISPLIYLGMAPSIEWTIAKKIFLKETLPVWAFLAVSVGYSRWLFASRQVLPAFALLLLTLPFAVWWALEQPL